MPCSFSYKPLKTSHTCSFFFSNCTIKNFRWGLESLTCSSWAFCSFAKQRWGKFAGMSTSGKFGSCVQFLLVNDRSHGRMMVFKLFGNLLVTLPRQIGSNNCFSKIITWLGCHRVCGTLWWFCGSPLWHYPTGYSKQWDTGKYQIFQNTCQSRPKLKTSIPKKVGAPKSLGSLIMSKWVYGLTLSGCFMSILLQFCPCF